MKSASHPCTLETKGRVCNIGPKHPERAPLSVTVFDTSLGLLGRVQAGDSEAWQAFSDRCYQVIHGWCRWNRVNQDDADDVAQNAMLVVVKKIGVFQHNGRGSFRAWLKAIAWRCRCDALVRTPPGQLSTLSTRYDEAVDEIGRMEQQFEALRQQDLMQQAMLLVKQRVRPLTWMAFTQTTLAGESGPAVAENLRMPLYSVYASRARVQRLIQQEVRKLELRNGTHTSAAPDVAEGS